ncbi:MAG: T9SS type A sorting domain-containing protein [Chitinophagales bacterium]|nr:T9SS type A sorting domain-containing protein [Chitinophagales bacterium]MDW8418918.1 kelch repeat-containing protein [Chitinophagales bacterium]
MKSKTILLFALILTCIHLLNAQGVWFKKSNYPTILFANSSFEINGFGYVYTGSATNNFYRYDPTNDTWTAMADFPGGSRNGVAFFAIGNEGFVGGGVTNGVAHSSFYKYDVATNTWAPVADLPDSISFAYCFSIGGVGYVAGGNNNNGTTAKTYAYNPGTNTWSVKSNMTKPQRAGFSAVVGGMAYCGFGHISGTMYTDSVYSYNPVSDQWTHVSNHSHGGGIANLSRFGVFVLNNQIYIGSLSINSNIFSQMLVYTPSTNSWATIYKFPHPIGNCGSFKDAVVMNISGRAFLGGYNNCVNEFWEFDPQYHFNLTSYSPQTVCEAGQVSVSFTSNISFGTGNTFVLKYNGNNYPMSNGVSNPVSATLPGTYTFNVPHLMNTGYFTFANMVVYSSNPVAATTLKTDTLIVGRSPAQPDLVNELYMCAGSALTLYRTNVQGLYHQWTSNPWTFSSVAHTVTLQPNINTTVYVQDSMAVSGCIVNDSIKLYVSNGVSLGWTDSVYSICPGSSVTLGGVPVANASYQWSGNGLSSTLVNPVVTPTASASYQLLIEDTLYKCQRIGNAYVNLYEAPSPAICYVTVDSASMHNVIIWEKPDISYIDSFYILRETSTQNYVQIGALHHNALSVFNDVSANPNITGYRYKIAVRDTCGNSSILSPYHHTIHLQYLGNGNLNWNVYEVENAITPIASFDVYYKPQSNTNWLLMVNVPGTQSSVTDINYTQHPNVEYRVVANLSYSCNPSRSSTQSLSNILKITTIGLNDLDMKVWDLYPNPSNGKLYISGATALKSLTIKSVDGRLLMATDAVSNEIDISSLPKGLLLIELVGDGFKDVERLIHY